MLDELLVVKNLNTNQSLNSSKLAPQLAEARDVFPMIFYSILFERTEDSLKKETLEAPVFFIDLNLDQIIDAITAGRQEYNLKPFFYTPLKDIDAIKYRQEIMRDLENETLLENIKSFAQKMRVMRRYLALVDKLYTNTIKKDGSWRR